VLKDRDNGYKALLKKAFGADWKIQVGILSAEGAKSKEEPDGKKSKLTVLDVAYFHEFGLGVPERSFLRGWLDEKQGEVEKALTRMAESVLAGKREPEPALNVLGQAFVGGIQKRITEHIPPPLAEETIKRKGSDVPLIDTGQLRSSISYSATVKGENVTSKGGG
jgi:hypothetical protein